MIRLAGQVVRVNIISENPSGCVHDTMQSCITGDQSFYSYAVILFSNAFDASQAIQMFHGYCWKGYILELEEDKSLSNVIGSKRHAANLEQNFTEISEKIDIPEDLGNIKQVLVSNIPFIIGWQDLKDLFRESGNVIRADIKTDSKTGKSRGCGSVVFSSPKEAYVAYKMFHQFEWYGRKIDVTLSERVQKKLVNKGTRDKKHINTSRKAQKQHKSVSNSNNILQKKNSFNQYSHSIDQLQERDDMISWNISYNHHQEGHRGFDKPDLTQVDSKGTERAVGLLTRHMSNAKVSELPKTDMNIHVWDLASNSLAQPDLLGNIDRGGAKIPSSKRPQRSLLHENADFSSAPKPIPQPIGSERSHRHGSFSSYSSQSSGVDSQKSSSFFQNLENNYSDALMKAVPTPPNVQKSELLFKALNNNYDSYIGSPSNYSIIKATPPGIFSSLSGHLHSSASFNDSVSSVAQGNSIISEGLDSHSIANQGLHRSPGHERRRK